MTRLLTINDFIHAYFTFCNNSQIQTSLYQPIGMMSEMNEIKEDYDNIGRNWPNGEKITIQLVLRKCVRGILLKGHQYCIPVTAIDKAVDALLLGAYTKNGKTIKFVSGNKVSEDFNDFEELYETIKSLLNIPSIGAVTVYDTARRIGHILGTPIYPQKYVYLPAKKVKNAGCFIVGKEMEGREPLSIFSPHFGTLPPLFIEDILCIFSHWFWKYSDCSLNYSYKKGEKRIGLPWWSLEVKTFWEQCLNETRINSSKQHHRWKEFPMIAKPTYNTQMLCPINNLSIHNNKLTLSL